MNFLDAQNGGEEERQEYLDCLDLSWAGEYIGDRSYIHKMKRTQAQVIVSGRPLFGIKGGVSNLEVFKGPFRGKHATGDNFLSLVRDHEGKHAHLSYAFPNYFDSEPIFGNYPLLHKVQTIVEEIICDEFQARQIEATGLLLSPKRLIQLERDIRKSKKKLEKIGKGNSLDTVSLELIDILSGDHKYSDEIRFGT